MPDSSADFWNLVEPRTRLESARINGLSQATWYQARFLPSEAFGVCSVEQVGEVLELRILFPCGRLGQATFALAVGDHPDAVHLTPPAGFLAHQGLSEIACTQDEVVGTTIPYQLNGSALDLPCLTIEACRTLKPELSSMANEVLDDVDVFVRSRDRQASLSAARAFLREIRWRWQSCRASPEQLGWMLAHLRAEVRVAWGCPDEDASPPSGFDTLSVAPLRAAFEAVRAAVWQRGRWRPYDQPLAMQAIQRGLRVAYEINAEQRVAEVDASLPTGFSRGMCFL